MLSLKTLNQQRNTLNKLFEANGLTFVKRPTYFLASATVPSYNQLSSLIAQIKEYYSDCTFYYRGQECDCNVLLPSVARGSRAKTRFYVYCQNHVEKEYEYISAFQEYCKTHHPDYYYENYLQFLAICQHYGIPTRLLDVTANADVAAYFATEYCKHGVGCIYIFIQPPQSEEEAILQQFILEQPQLLHHRQILGVREAIDIFLSWHPEIKTKALELLQIITNHYDHRALLHVAPSNELKDERVVHQEGSFMLFGNALWSLPTYQKRLEKQGFKATEDVFIANALSKDSLKGVIRLRIPAECKASILRCVMGKGITREFVYPSFESCAQTFLKNYEFENLNETH